MCFWRLFSDQKKFLFRGHSQLNILPDLQETNLTRAKESQMSYISVVHIIDRNIRYMLPKIHNINCMTFVPCYYLVWPYCYSTNHCILRRRKLHKPLQVMILFITRQSLLGSSWLRMLRVCFKIDCWLRDLIR